MKTLYNRYISEQNLYIPIEEEGVLGGRKADEGRTKGVQKEDEGRTKGVQKEDKGRTGSVPGGEGRRSGGLFRGALGNLGLEKVDFSSILQKLHLEELDSGDILLGLIILFLILEDGDNLDLIITLGLMILFSLGDSSD